MIRENVRDAVFSLVLLGICGLIFLETRKPQYLTAKEQDYGFDPAFFPRILLLLWAVLCLFILGRALLSMWVTNKNRQIEAPLWRHFILAVSLTALYLGAMAFIGFLFSSIPFVAAFLYLFGYRNWPILLLIAVLFPVIAWWVFVYPLHIPLPVSPWFTRL